MYVPHQATGRKEEPRASAFVITGKDVLTLSRSRILNGPVETNSSEGDGATHTSTVVVSILGLKCARLLVNTHTRRRSQSKCDLYGSVPFPSVTPLLSPPLPHVPIPGVLIHPRSGKNLDQEKEPIKSMPYRHSAMPRPPNTHRGFISSKP